MHAGGACRACAAWSCCPRAIWPPRSFQVCTLPCPCCDCRRPNECAQHCYRPRRGPRTKPLSELCLVQGWWRALGTLS